VIKLAVAGGVALYGFCVVLAAAGFTSIVPLVVIVPILVLLIGGGNLLGGRSHGRSRGGRMAGFAPAPLSSSGPNSPVAPAGSTLGPDATDRANGVPVDPGEHADTEGAADPEQADPKQANGEQYGGEQANGGQHGGGEPGEHE
jgi:hypothetical protein